MKFENLQVSSVAGILTVNDGFVSDIMTACGRNIKDLDLAGCEQVHLTLLYFCSSSSLGAEIFKRFLNIGETDYFLIGCRRLTDFSLKSIGENCYGLRALNIANLHKLTDWGLLNLADGCRSMQKLKLCGNDFSDEAIASFLEMSGESLGELSLNHVSKVGSSTALSLAKCSRKLLSLDLSWCWRVTNEALGLIVDSSFSLKLLKLFGCTQITNVLLNGHSNPLVWIIGLNLTSVLEHVGMLEAEETLLRYSPLLILSVSQNVDH